VVDLEHVDAGQLLHPPGACVQARAEDDDLRRRSLAYRRIDRDRARDHQLSAGTHRLVVDPFGPARGRRAGTDLVDGDPFSVAQHRDRHRVGEPADRDASIRGGPALADQNGGTAGFHRRHATGVEALDVPAGRPHRHRPARRTRRTWPTRSCIPGQLRASTADPPHISDPPLAS
jgi:hypothetical protein